MIGRVCKRIRLIGVNVLLLTTAAVAFTAGNDLRLIDAARAKDAAAMRGLLKAGVDANSTQGDGATALHWAVHYDDIATADLLLGAGARANAANDLGVTPLYLACTNRNAPMVERLLKAGADPNLGNPDNQTPLLLAARTGSLPIVEMLVKAGAKVNAPESTRQQTPLMWAIDAGNPAVVDFLIRHKAKVDVRAAVNDWGNQITSEPRAQYRPSDDQIALDSGSGRQDGSLFQGAGRPARRPTPEPGRVWQTVCRPRLDAALAARRLMSKSQAVRHVSRAKQSSGAPHGAESVQPRQPVHCR